MTKAVSVEIKDDDALGAEMGEGVDFSPSYSGSCYERTNGASDSANHQSCTRLAGHSGLHMQNKGAWGKSPVVVFYWVRED